MFGTRVFLYKNVKNKIVTYKGDKQFIKPRQFEISSYGMKTAQISDDKSYELRPTNQFYFQASFVCKHWAYFKQD
jgi:hypothetical protein